MPDSPLLQHPRNRFLAFSMVGVAMVCLPLWQVLRYQQSELHHLAAERALLDPVARAVHVQLGLVAHRQVAGQLLKSSGKNAAAMEPARQSVQVGVDDELLKLGHELTQGAWLDAWSESRELTRDWNVLVQHVKSRSLTPKLSNEAHSLRVEQVVQVMDLIGAAEGLLSQASPGRPALNTRLAAVATTLSTATWDLTTLQQATAAPTGDARTNSDTTPLALHLQSVEGQLARLERLLAQRSDETDKRATPAALPHSLQGAWTDLQRHTTEALRLAQAETGAEASLLPLLQAQQASLQAQKALWDAVVAQHKRGISQRVNQVQRQQLALGVALALLGSTALVLAAGLLRRLRLPFLPPQPPMSAAGNILSASQAGSVVGMGRPKGSKQAEAAELFSRLRSANDEVQPLLGKPTHPEPEDTLPPGRA